MNDDYEIRFQEYLEQVMGHSEGVRESRLEHHFECLNDWNLFHSIEDVKEWFSRLREDCKMLVTDIPLNDCKNWHIESDSGNIVHESGEFFTVHGIRVDIDSREVGMGGWDQPILTQVGFDGGLLGILRQRFQGIPHYLIEAKAEPGNYEKLQLSPTLQATFSNLRRAHEGRKPNFSHFFEDPKENESTVLYNQWMSEDGGRLHLKRNRGMLVEVPEGTVTEIPDGFIWLSMWQIKDLLNENAWINPHIRGIIAHL
jgi:oxidase EvaA